MATSLNWEWRVTLHDLQSLMPQLGPQLSEITLILQEESDRWLIGFDEGVQIGVHWQSASARLLLSCVLGEAHADHESEVYARMLNANLIGLGSDGIRIALSEQSQIMVVGEFDSVAPRLERLCEVLSHFVQRVAELTNLASSVAIAPGHSIQSKGGPHLLKV